ncbi:hypothetical protein P5673_009308, partial [Acropora cervicornis]
MKWNAKTNRVEYTRVALEGRFTAAAATAKTATSYDEQHNQQKRDRHRNAYSGVFIKPPANKACMKVKLAD